MCLCSSSTYPSVAKGICASHEQEISLEVSSFESLSSEEKNFILSLKRHSIFDLQCSTYLLDVVAINVQVSF